jgi:glutathione peroxidase-family protein
MQHDILNTEVTTIDGEKTTLASFAGKVLLIVNVASKCGLTPQYEQLEDLQKQFAGEGFSVLGFPCNQFLGQEPGSEEEIKTFCSTTYGVTFPLFSKIDVNGEHRAPLYQNWLPPRRRRWPRKAAVFMSGWPAKAGRRCTWTTFCGISKNSSSIARATSFSASLRI